MSRCLSNRSWSRGSLALACAGVLAVLGCNNRPTLLPNSDPGLRKTSTQFAADAVKRHPYKADAPKSADLPARAQVGYSLNRVEVVNLSDEDWSDVEVWVNEQYVVAVPSMKRNQLKTLPFTMIFNDKGEHFPLKNKQAMVSKVEVLRDGTLYEVPVTLAD